MGAYLTIRETANRLHMHFMTVYKLVQEGTLPAMKIGNRWKIDEDDLGRWLSTSLSPHTKRVLLADQDQSTRQLFGEVLSLEDCDLVVVDTSHEVLEEVRSRYFEVIFLDLEMEPLDGAQTYGEIRRIDPGTMVVFLAADEPLRHRLREAAQHGPISLLLKPVDPDLIRSVVQQIPKRQAPKRLM